MYYKTTIIKTVILDHEQNDKTTTTKIMLIQGKIKVAFQISGERMHYLINLVDIITNVGEEK